MEKPKSIAELEKLFDEKIINEIALTLPPSNEAMKVVRFLRKEGKQFWLEHYRSLIEGLREEDMATKGLDIKELDKFGNLDCCGEGEVSGYNLRNQEVNTAIQTLLGS